MTTSEQARADAMDRWWAAIDAATCGDSVVYVLRHRGEWPSVTDEMLVARAQEAVHAAFRAVPGLRDSR